MPTPIQQLNSRINRLFDELDDLRNQPSSSIVSVAPSGGTTAPTAITSIDFYDTGNPNELGVRIDWTDSTGAAQTTIDATPVTLPTNTTLETATADFTTTNGVDVAIGGSYLELSNGETWAFENIENPDASNLNGAPQDLSTNALSLLPDHVAWHFHVRNNTVDFSAGGATMNVTIDGANGPTGVTSHTVPVGAQGFVVRVSGNYQVIYRTLANTGISADPDQKLTLGSDNLPYLGPECTDVTEQFTAGPTNNGGTGSGTTGLAVTEITVNKAQDITVVHTGTGFTGAAGSGFGVSSVPLIDDSASVNGSDIFTSGGDRIFSATPSKTYTVSLPSAGTYYIGVFSGGLSSVTSNTLDVTYCKPVVDIDVRFVETRCYEEPGAALPILDNDAFADEINATQLATLPAGAHLRWTAPSAVTLDTLEVNGFGSTVAISWSASTGDTGSQSVTFGANPQGLNLGITLPAGGTIDFTLDSISAGQMQLTTPATSVANGWTALQDYSAFATTSHWATRLLTSSAVFEHKVNVYEDTNGDTVYAEVNGEDLTDLTAIPGTWTQVSCAEPDIDIDWIKEECYNLPGTNYEFTTNAPVTANNGNMLQASGAVAPSSAPLRLANSGTEPIQVDTVRVRAGANGFVALPAGNLTIGGVQYIATAYDDINGIYRTIVFTPNTTPLVLQPGDSFTSQGNWGLMTGGFQGPVSSGAGTNPPFGAGTQARAEIEYTVGTPLPGDEVTVRTYEDGSLKLVDKTANTLTDLAVIDPTWTPCVDEPTPEGAIEVQLSGNFTLPTAVDGDVHHFSVEALPVSIDTTGGEPIDGDLDFTRYTVGDQLTALPQQVGVLGVTGTPITATQPDSSPNTVTWEIVPGVVELTRGANGGLLNSAQGQSGNNGGAVTITDVEWFYDQGNTELPIAPSSVTDTTTPTTTSMSAAFDGAIGDEILAPLSYIRVISTGQVFQLDFTAWQQGGGGGFSGTATEITMVPTLGWNVRKSVGEFISADANNALQRRADGLYVQEPQDVNVLSSFVSTAAAVERLSVDGVPFLCLADNEATFTSYTSQDIITPRDVTADVYIDFTIKRATAAQPDSTFRQTSNFTAYFQQLTFNAETGVASVSSGGGNPDPEIILADVGTEFIRYVVRFTEMPGSSSESWRFRPAGDTLGTDTGTVYITEDGFSASVENPVTATTNQLIQSGTGIAGTTVTFSEPFAVAPVVTVTGQFNADRIISLNTVTATAFDGVSWNTGTNLASSGEVFHWQAIGLKP